MFADIALPKNNEPEFIELASKLKLKKIYFLYEFGEYLHEKIPKKLSEIKNPQKIDIVAGVIVNQKNLNESARHSKFLVVKSSDKDRVFIETKKINAIYGFEEQYKKDFLHQRASGLNHIICELAKRNNIAIGFSYSSLFNKNRQESAMLAGRMIQNISLCQKYKVKTMIGLFSSNPYEMRAQHDIISLFSVLGMDGKTARDSMDYNL